MRSSELTLETKGAEDEEPVPVAILYVLRPNDGFYNRLIRLGAQLLQLPPSTTPLVN
ncbi:hypothetical protein RvY_14456 [Ramazzottius varieornatus]|uniref:Uncharacterized protein n=1 Tax=Ramazzottius varieornatus TaxID=947166 RepID=A0A1D1VZT3_RAMVA|nr:hypothetical protein RvY_14456 [Ramazzottius varieornatus]